jgi:glycosyltransferase involved in cell wall biosynthesis
VERGKAPRISAILPTWNRANYLSKALKALVAQTIEQDEFEVIVVDDGSSDATQQVVDLFKDSLHLTYLYQENAGIAAAKNRGVERARAPLLLFMDDDDVASPTLLEEHLWSHERYPDPTTAVLGRTDLSSPIALRPVMHFVTEVEFYLFCYPSIPADEWLDYTYFWGGRSSCKTVMLQDHGCFNPVFRFGCEDIELGYRLSKFGLRVVYNPRAVSAMVRALSFDEFCRRVERQGESNWVFSVIHPVEEVLRWGDIVGARARWAELEGDFETILAKARHLDRIAELRLEEGLKLDEFLVAELHGAYRQSFDGCRLRGIVKGAARADYGVSVISPARGYRSPQDRGICLEEQN